MIGDNKKTIAVMQPYFFPYAGYYQLFHGTDTFVILDCVQFPRRGWVHRNQFSRFDGSVDWLTLPIRKCPQDTQIKDLEFDLNQRHSDFIENMFKFRVSEKITAEEREVFFNFNQPVVDLLESQLKLISKALGFQVKIIRSSGLSLPTELKGQHRILEIVKALGADKYINLSGGIDLYDFDYFRENGIGLEILKPFLGDKRSILERIKFESISMITKEIIENSRS